MANEFRIDEAIDQAAAFFRGAVDWLTSPQVQSMVETALEFMRRGFGQVNAVEGLLIAFLATLAVGSWRQIPAMAVMATLVNILIDATIPVLSERAAFHLPDVVHTAFWEFAASLFAGYVIVIAVLFALKKALGGMGFAGRQRAHA